MGFNLSGYEKDNINVIPFAFYTIIGCVFFIIVAIFIHYYFIIQQETIYSDTLTKGTTKSENYKKNQLEILNKEGSLDDSTKLVPIETAITKALQYYND